LTGQTEASGSRWADLGRTELIALGKSMVTERLEELGCRVGAPGGLARGHLDVATPSGLSLEVFVSTQRVGGYVFWTKRRFEPDGHRFAAIALLDAVQDPGLYLIPSIEWRHPSPPLKDRPNVGKRSEPEYGITLARSSLAALGRFGWDAQVRLGYFL
jgi:hypothetical protein